MADSGPRRKLAAILAADVVGFSKLMGENEDRTLRNLKACRSLTDEAIKLNHFQNTNHKQQQHLLPIQNNCMLNHHLL